MKIRSRGVPDTSHATTGVASSVVALLTAKNAQDRESVMSHYSRRGMCHDDAILGWVNHSWEELDALYAEYMPQWGDGKAWPTRIIGHDRSAIVMLTETPELFGGEIRTLSAVDFDDNGIIRLVDYWDGRLFGAQRAAELRAPAEDFPSVFGAPTIREQATGAVVRVESELDAVLSSGEAGKAARLFSYDATFEDLTLRVRAHGPASIGGVLAAAADRLPYGAGAAVCHVLGGDLGGGYEWTNPESPARRGITALSLDEKGLIEDLTVVWDGSLVESSFLGDLARSVAEAQVLS